MERYNGDNSGTTQQRCAFLLDDSCAGERLSHDHHVTSSPLNRIGNRKRRTRVLPTHPDREKKVHPFVLRVKLATHSEMRHLDHLLEKWCPHAQSAGRTALPAVSASPQLKRG
jgi:hypothetical protein